jgi:hypothetical protein
VRRKSFFEFMRMEKVAVSAPDYKSCGVPSGNAIAAQRQRLHNMPLSGAD